MKTSLCFFSLVKNAILDSEASRAWFQGKHTRKPQNVWAHY